jgi:hypothetical protein
VSLLRSFVEQQQPTAREFAATQARILTNNNAMFYWRLPNFRKLFFE